MQITIYHKLASLQSKKCGSVHVNQYIEFIIEMEEHRDRNCMKISTDSEKALAKPTFLHDQNFGEAIDCGNMSQHIKGNINRSLW